METKAKLPMDYDNYVFDLYGTLVDINTDENKEELWKKIAMFYGYYGAIYDPSEMKGEYERLVKGKEKELKSTLAGDPKYAHEASPEIEITDVFLELFEQKGVKAARELAMHAGQFFRVLATEFICLYPGTREMLAALKNAGKKVYLGAADTFRAAAVEQLVIWSERVDVPIVKQKMGSDPASVAFDTLSSAKANDADVVIIDTAGRLHNKINLMNELTKIKNVMKKVVPEAPHEVLLVLDGSTGQNAFEQAKQFTAATEVNALAVTKLDGTAKGGVVIGISDHFHIPVKYIGLGEGMEDLQVFNRKEFVNSLFGE